jgi:hypothetical protein
VEAPEDAGAALDERLDLEVLLPDGAVPQVLRESGLEDVRRLEEVPVGRDDEVLVRPCGALRARQFANRLNQPVGTPSTHGEMQR